MRSPSVCSFLRSVRSSPTRPSISPTEVFDTWRSKVPRCSPDISPSLLSVCRSNLTIPCKSVPQLLGAVPEHRPFRAQRGQSILSEILVKRCREATKLRLKLALRRPPVDNLELRL